MIYVTRGEGEWDDTVYVICPVTSVRPKASICYEFWYEATRIEIKPGKYTTIKVTEL
jgi:hypothetical protein